VQEKITHGQRDKSLIYCRRQRGLAPDQDGRWVSGWRAGADAAAIQIGRRRGGNMQVMEEDAALLICDVLAYVVTSG
jgi:hypothetical protein